MGATEITVEALNTSQMSKDRSSSRNISGGASYKERSGNGSYDDNQNYSSVEKKYQEDGVWLVDLSDGQTRRLGDDDVDKYEVGTAFYIVSPVGGGSGINFLADDWEYSGSHTVQGAP